MLEDEDWNLALFFTLVLNFRFKEVSMYCTFFRSQVRTILMLMYTSKNFLSKQYKGFHKILW